MFCDEHGTIDYCPECAAQPDGCIAVSEWTNTPPTKKGWWFWRKDESCTDPRDWDCDYYFGKVPGDGNEIGQWAGPVLGPEKETK